MMFGAAALLLLAARASTKSHGVVSTELDEACAGYNVSHLQQHGSRVEAQLDLVGAGCGVYGPDVAHLKLLVEYETYSRLHVMIEDRYEERYQVPEELFPRPSSTPLVSSAESLLSFELNDDSGLFSFRITRRDTSEVLFDTTKTSLIFERQFLRLKTWLPKDPHLYGLGEHADPFHLKSKDYLRTLWNRDSGAIPEGENLYGSHPIYFEHRMEGTHGVLLMNSNGMDVAIDSDEKDRQFLEYRTIGGVLDLYFFAGPTPQAVARQYSELISRPAMVPYWSLGFHQCKYGYRDWFEVAEVVYNYSQAEIPLEVMWTDIDYMDHRLVFTLDKGNFPIDRMQDVVKYIHDRQQRYIMMVDPAVGKKDYHAYERGLEMDVFMKRENGSLFEGVVWPGVTVFPDWFHANGTAYWVEMFKKMFDPNRGVDIDGVWIDMNEPASFCAFPCDDPKAQAAERNLPPEPPAVRKPPRSIPGFPEHDEKLGIASYSKRCLSDVYQRLFSQAPLEQPVHRSEVNHEGDDLMFPRYHINNHVGELGEQTMHPNIKHANGLWTYETHNLYGALMSMATRAAMLARRPNLKPFIVTRSTFAGSGKAVAKWLGDNVSTWHHYRVSISGMLGFASIYQQPMVGSDVCGFLDDANEKLCARWTTLGAFMPFFRNHADAGSTHQEFYVWPLVADAARYAISMRYRLLDYLYTALQRQTDDGTPAISPVWFMHPQDQSTFAIDEQYYFGDCILVSPVVEKEATSVDIYLPDDIFYDLETHKAVRGRGEWVKQDNVPFDRIPLHIRGGCVLPLRSESANTTTELRKKGFELIVAPGLGGKAQGSLYVDDGESLDGGNAKTRVQWQYNAGQLNTVVAEGFASLEKAGIKVEKVTILGAKRKDGKKSSSSDEL